MRKRLFLRITGGGLVAVLAGLLAGTAVAAPEKQSPPDALIRALSNEVLESIRKDPALQSGDMNKLQALVDTKILPYVNFEKMTQLAVGRGWRQASADQRAALTREFRALLVRTYSGAVSAVSDHKVQLRPYRARAEDTDVVVRTQVMPTRGEPIQLDYRLEKTEAGWKIYDVNVLGIWLVENYKNSFASEINQGGVDGLIKTLSERNKELAAQKN